eukprot:gene17610-23184_t
MKGNKYQVEALYKVAPGLGMNRMKSFISEARLIAQQEIGNDDWLDSSFRIENGWKTPLIAIDNMHSPKSVNDLLLSNKNYERLAFDELLALELQREENIKQSIDNTTTSFALVGPTTLTQSLIKSLPFELTVSQLKSIDNILNDLADTKRMVHLLQGDVCSGKSIVAFIALFRAVECGKQGILLAPVELLVTQFYNNLQQLLNNLASKNLTIKIPTIGYITGSVKGDDRINLLENIRNGNCDIIIGTQALFTESVFQSISNNLGLVVVDEEQRFGVNQRKELSELTNVLFTTATPIPRSLTIFNEKQLSVSTLTDMPLYRRTIQTVLIGLSRVDDLLLRIDEHIKFDSKFYWVTDSIDSSCNQLRGSAIDRFELLSKRYPNKVGLLHGQLKSEEKDQVMKSFILNEIQILVCTSVIEVGIDVSDVSFCIIERPERFGLSQLHQIRGRIGRGKAPKNENIENCFCVLLYDDINSTSQPVILSNAHNVDSDMIIPYTKPPKEKLEYLVKCNNGFDIAELDLQLRGPGDIFGIKQSGNFSLDGELVNIAQFDVTTGTWSNKFQAELSAVESNGVILDVVLNRSSNFDKMYVVGTFDTMTSTSQVQFCSVGAWNGQVFEKLGEGLCPRGNGPQSITRIQTVTIGSDGDLFVGGNFESRVWDGGHFVSIYYVARFHTSTSSWTPLSNGLIKFRQAAQEPRVNALAWDSSNDILYIGGNFDALDNKAISNGLAIWSNDFNLTSFSTSGAYLDSSESSGGTILAMQYEIISQSLFVSGNFGRIGGIDCKNVAVWQKYANKWTCLHNETKAILTVTAMTLCKQILYLTGWAAETSDWPGRNWMSPYAIATLDISGYIRQYSNIHDNNTISNANKSYRRKLKQRKSKSNSINSTSNYLTNQPSRNNDTSKTLWKPVWSWLDGFAGGNGPIMRIIPGKYDLENCLFIVGAFNNYEAVIVWCMNDSSNSLHPIGTISSISNKHQLYGLVTSVVQLLIPIDVIPTPMPVPNPSDNFTEKNRLFLIFISFSFLFGGIVGLIVLRKRSTDSNDNNSFKSNDLSINLSDNIGSIRLTTLSGSENNNVDFRACFERAMHARHLPTHESLLIINPKEVVLSKIIGEGSFGRVWSGYWRNNAVAIKEFVFAQAAVVGGSVERNNIIEEIVGEAGIMACLRHPKILQIYGCSLTMQAIWIASELCNRGSLRMLLNDKSVDIAWIKKLSICLDVADGMLYLHTRNPPIIHRDLKSHNIFIIESSPGRFVAKIGDWGSARALALSGTKSMTQGVGTACWLAPEVIYNARFSKDSDVYAYGILLWEVYTRQEVHEGLSAAQIIAKVAHEGLRPPIPRFCPWNTIMTECWKQNPKERPGFSKIMTSLSSMYSAAKASVRKSNRLNEGVSPKINIGTLDEEISSNNAIFTEEKLTQRTQSSPNLHSNDDLTKLNNKLNSASSPLPNLLSINRLSNENV